LPEIVITVARYGFLVLLWIFVFTVVGVIRRDLFVGARSSGLASARHARPGVPGGQWFVEDLGSTNGTYLDRAKVTAPTPVPLGVPIRIGRTSLELRP
jgi:pSer/pThr/pTyr-binding forkhead associated (FHA) protein